MAFVDTLKSKPVLPEGKDKVVYLVLAIFLGSFGVHNLWAGGECAEKGKAELILGIVGILGGWYITCGLLSLVSLALWIMDVIAVFGEKKAA